MNLGYLFAAYSLIWTALFIFLLLLAKKISVLNRDVEILKEKYTLNG